jgi:hypothetical protein
MNPLFKTSLARGLAALCFSIVCRAQGAPDLNADLNADVKWLLQYDGKALPASPWIAQKTPNATVQPEGLRLVDSDAGYANYRAAFQSEPDEELIVEAVVKTAGISGSQPKKTAASLWPWRDGAPVALQVSDGKHQDGLVLFPAQAASFTDRFIPMDTTHAFHTYRLVIRGSDMQIWVDGVKKVEGQGAFWKPADSP